ncbi:serine/threonine-protein kinase PrkC [Variibacter gotjawalensis]|uniref:Serine/threonine-protein kinase PrkC n=1 Tax=Variibacter gotjawalensis TaxID=1333996 RepID=A0A0S3PST2_9BRAD|nr:serine/threonine-protein kinase [Variibacter gotjawalensis]NIK49192.1 non-specific serine/threonine protein kinase/serine/threonine-protein kinase [Variibacter gotjawalensis]RZS51046.1 non-specific serine/threonine protein kinase/serine/threonine-protein kinase [Variibacter gotjawalensis]BAT58880.1 serine/threonine-protein kinase PrkC [Variibacter gotjawalensis]
MDAKRERWNAVRGLFDDLVDRPPPEREQILARSTLAPDIVEETRQLLVAADATGDFMEAKAVEAKPEYSSLKPGERVGAFRIEELIGRGGQGEVYRASRADGAFDQTVALKLLRPEAAQHFERFKTERQILAGLEHPGIARLIDGGIAPDGRPYAAMEYVEGVDIATYCAENNLDLAARLKLFADVCAAVAHAHRNLIVHRDLKPGNILVTRDGQVKLLDFGIARFIKETDQGAMTEAIVTPDYTAPEQLEGRLPTTATDVYALGANLFEVLVGKPPWRIDGSPFPAALRILQDEPPRASQEAAKVSSPPIAPTLLTGDIDAIIAKTMRREPALRYEGASALAEDIGRHLALRPVEARAGDTWYRVRRFLRRRRGALAAVALVLLVAVGGLTAYTWQSYRTAIASERAKAETARAEAVRDYVMLSFRAAGGAGRPGLATAKQVLDSAASELVREADAGTARPELFRVIGELYAEIDDFAAAAPLLERYIKLAPPSETVAIAQAKQSLAVIAVRRGQLDAARRYLTEARAEWMKEPQRFAREIGEADAIEASLLRQNGKREDGIALLRSSTEAARKLLGEDSEILAIRYNNLGVHYIESGQAAEADAAFNEAWRLLEKQGRMRSGTAIAVMSHRAAAQLRAGNVPAAEAMWREAVELRRTLYGPSMALASLQLNYGRLLIVLEKPDEALKVFDEALPAAITFGGPASQIAIILRQSRAVTLLMRDRIDDATAENNEALIQARGTYGERHLYTALGIVTRCAINLRRGDLDAARADADTAESILKELGPSAQVHLDEVAKLRAVIAGAAQQKERP